jgi:hypothetical protein
MISKLVSVKPLENYSIFVTFSDGVQGVVDLQHLAKKGVFQAWDNNNLFSKVHIDDFGAIAWNDDIDICPDKAYLQLKGMSFEQWKRHNNCAYATN